MSSRKLTFAELVGVLVFTELRCGERDGTRVVDWIAASTPVDRFLALRSVAQLAGGAPIGWMKWDRAAAHTAVLEHVERSRS